MGWDGGGQTPIQAQRQKQHGDRNDTGTYRRAQAHTRERARADARSVARLPLERPSNRRAQGRTERRARMGQRRRPGATRGKKRAAQAERDGQEQDRESERGQRGTGAAPELRLLRLLLIVVVLLHPVIPPMLMLVLLPIPLLPLAAPAAAAPAVADGGAVVARDEVLLLDPLPRLHAGKLDVVAPVLCGRAPVRGVCLEGRRAGSGRAGPESAPLTRTIWPRMPSAVWMSVPTWKAFTLVSAAFAMVREREQA